MDVNEMRSVITAISLLAFLAIALWAYSRRNKSRFDEASRIPFADDDMDRRSTEDDRSNHKPEATNG